MSELSRQLLAGTGGIVLACGAILMIRELWCIVSGNSEGTWKDWIVPTAGLVLLLAGSGMFAAALGILK